MYKVRQWSVSQSAKLEKVYQIFESTLMRLHPLFSAIGYQRVEQPVRVVEKALKSLMFDCKMCGRCVLSSTGMSCPMNCPKSIRNGPCGGVRLDGQCEVKPEMRCVWVEAWRGSRQMQQGDSINQVQIPVNNLLRGSSSWLRVLREHNADEKGVA